MKSRIALFLAITMVLAFFAGCSTSDSTPATPAAETETQTVEATQPPAATEAAETAVPETEAPGSVDLPLVDEPETLTYWYVLTGAFNYIDDLKDLSVWKEMEERTNVTVEFQVVGPPIATERFNIMVAGGDMTDIVYAWGTMYSGGESALLDDGVIVDLSEYLEEYAPNYTAIRNRTEINYKATMLDDGRIPAFYLFTKEGIPVTNGMVIRQDWLDELGMEIPYTYDELHDVLTAFKTEYDATLWIPYYGPNYLGYGFGLEAAADKAAGLEPFYQIDGTVYCGPMEDAMYDYLSLAQTWYAEGLIYPDFMAATDIQVDEAAVAQDRCGVWSTSQGSLSYFAGVNADPDFRAVAIPYTRSDASETLYFADDVSVETAQGMNYITTDCENIELAVRWMDYRYSDEGIFLMNYGLEGEGWEYDENGEPALTDLIVNNPEGLAINTGLELYATSRYASCVYDWEKLEIGYTEDQMTAPDMWGYQFEIGYRFPLGMSMTAEEEQTFTDIYTELSVYINEWTLNVITGETPLTEESFDEFRSHLESMGVQTCIGVQQAALDRFNAR